MRRREPRRLLLEDFYRDARPHEDAMLADGPVLSHSVLSPELNLGLLDPMECVAGAEAAYLAGRVPIASAEGYVRQILGWRDYVWHIYLRAGPAYGARNALDATARVPRGNPGRRRSTAGCRAATSYDVEQLGV